MKKVLVIRAFRDTQDEVVRHINDTFEAEDDRAADLKEKGFVSFDEEDSNPKTVDFVVTQEYFDSHPDLIEKEVKVGDTIQLSAEDDGADKAKPAAKPKR